MKSIVIVFAMCALFLALSVKLPGTGRTAAASTDEKRCVIAEKTTQAAPAVKRGKPAGLPRWHRVIPGMFR